METYSIFVSFRFETIASNRFPGDQLAPTHWIFHGAALNLHRMTVEKKKKKQVQICLNEVRIIWLN